MFDVIFRFTIPPDKVTKIKITKFKMIIPEQQLGEDSLHNDVQ